MIVYNVKATNNVRFQNQTINFVAYSMSQIEKVFTNIIATQMLQWFQTFFIDSFTVLYTLANR